MWFPWRSKVAEDAREAELAAQHAERVRQHNLKTLKQTGAAVAGTGALAIASALLCRRSVAARRYVPRMFNANVIPPKFNPMQDAARAVGDATLLATSFFAFGFSTALFLLGARNMRELGQTLVARYSPQRDIPDDPESARVQQELFDLISSRKK